MYQRVFLRQSSFHTRDSQSSQGGKTETQGRFSTGREVIVFIRITHKTIPKRNKWMTMLAGWLRKLWIYVLSFACIIRTTDAINLSMAIKDVLDFQSLPTFILVAMAIFFKGLVIFLGGKVTDMPFTLRWHKITSTNSMSANGCV